MFLPGESEGWGSLVGCHLWGRTESDMTEVTQQQQQMLPDHWHVLKQLCVTSVEQTDALVMQPC